MTAFSAPWYARISADYLLEIFNDNERLKIISPRQVWQHQGQEWTFKLSDAKSDLSYPKAGKLFAARLLEIKSEDVGNLAERGANLW